MSTPAPLVGVRVEHPAERSLFRGMFDDAAVFPPGLSPLSTAVTDHAARQSKSYADLVGPLLLPAQGIEELLRLKPPREVAVAVIGRPGTDLKLVHRALSRLGEHPVFTVTGAEVGWSADWHQAVGWNAPLSIEVPRGADQESALSEISKHADEPHRVQAKFRTGSTPDTAVPTPTELATFIRAAIDHDLSFKLTGGLHRAITRAAADGQDHFGFLNVIAATRLALAGGEVPEMSSLLSQRDPVPILDNLTRMSEADAGAVRAFFTAYGCCGVMDPIGDLASLGLIRETAV